MSKHAAALDAPIENPTADSEYSPAFAERREAEVAAHQAARHIKKAVESRRQKERAKLTERLDAQA